MAHVVVAVMALDTQLDDAVRALQKAGLSRIGMIVGEPIATEEAKHRGAALHPAVVSVMQMLKPDDTIKVEGLGTLTLSGVTATLADKSNRTAAGFLRYVFDHEVSEDVAKTMAQQLRDGHVLLSVHGDTDKARDILQKHRTLSLH